MHFETFRKSIVPLSREPTITIQKRGTITINAAARAVLGEPDAVELLFDAELQVLGLRPVSTDVPHAAFVRPSTRQPSGPWVISAMAFVRYWKIDTSVARRWHARLEQDVLCIHLDEPGEVVSRRTRSPQTDRTADPEPRPRPKPHA